ncbi:hypothetical protein JCM8097_009506 [Rhodosporidiobolus ruineniae]
MQSGIPSSLAMNPYQPIAPAPLASRPSSVNTPPTAPSSSTSGPSPPTISAPSAAAPPPAKKKRRSKVDSACRFCRRSHMQCSGERPCARCIKRDIAHLCTDEPIAGLDNPPAGGAAGSPASPAPPQPAVAVQAPPPGADGAAGSMLNTLGLDMAGDLGGAGAGGAGNPLAMMQGSLFGSTSGAGGGGLFGTSQAQGSQPMFTPDFNMAMLDLANDGLGAGLGLDMTTTGEGEFHGLGLSEFLQSLNDPLSFSTSGDPSSLPGASSTAGIGDYPINTDTGLSAAPPNAGVAVEAGGGVGAGAGGAEGKTKSVGASVPGSPINKTERFLLTAADQKDGSRSDRLARVIHAKFEAGLLRPYNHVAGYTRLMKWMSANMSASSRQRTLHTLSEFRPTFRAIASGLTDLDLVFIEEAFERLLLDYDRVFSSMGIPSCLWRRTGEIYKGNKEFAALVGVPFEDLQGGKLAIYELMAEESAVNYWEKYGNVAFDVGQKAVLTSCVLVNQSILARHNSSLSSTSSSSSSKSRKRSKPGDSTTTSTAGGGGPPVIPEEALVNACFSFTIRRDSYGIPSMVIGNAIPL